MRGRHRRLPEFYATQPAADAGADLPASKAAVGMTVSAPRSRGTLGAVLRNDRRARRPKRVIVSATLLLALRPAGVDRNLAPMLVLWRLQGLVMPDLRVAIAYIAEGGRRRAWPRRCRST
jgi:hypothetical protein